jgi:signal transduction histidine kinase
VLRSLYGRIALGFVAVLAVLLAVQGGLLLWLLTRPAEPFADSPASFAAFVALEVSAALEQNPAASIDDVLESDPRFRAQPFFVVLPDGRYRSLGNLTPPEALLRSARIRLQRRIARGPRPRDERTRPARPIGFAFVVADGRTVAAVVALPHRPTLWTVLREFGPVMGLVGIGTLVAGSLGAALLIFRPAHRRLRALEVASERVRQGDLSARADERGGDEVAALAVAFNRMAADLAQRAEQAATSDRLRRQLLADVSHELMTPLTSMRGYLETISMREVPLDDDTRARYLEIVDQETVRLEQIVRDLLDLAKLEAAGLRQARDPVAVGALFDRVRDRHGRAASEKGVELRVADPEALVVSGDALRLEQALQNLAANALRHTPSGGFVELTARAAGAGDAVLVVRDSGSGIDVEHLSSIFERFYKADGAREGRSSGSGLGLSIVKAIVDNHGGRIDVESERETGTRFTIRLPRWVGNSTSGPPAQ